MAAGNLYFPSDGHKIERSNGSTWDGWGPIYPLSDASFPTFAWQNQGTNTVATTYGGEEMTLPNVNNTWALALRYIALPAAPYSLTIGMLGTAGRLGVANDYFFNGLFVSDATKSKGIGIYNEFTGTDAGLVVFYYATGASAPSHRDPNIGACDLSSVTGRLGGYPYFLKFLDDNTNWYWQASANGRKWVTLLKEVRNTDLTATRIGYGASYAAAVASGTATGYAQLISWKAGTT